MLNEQGTPIPNAIVNLWSSDAMGNYDNEDDPLYTPECLVRCTVDASGTRYGTFDFVIGQVTEHQNVTPDSLAVRV